MSALISARSLCDTNLSSYIFDPDARERLRATFDGHRSGLDCAQAAAFSVHPVMPVPHSLEPAYHATASVASGFPTL